MKRPLILMIAAWVALTACKKSEPAAVNPTPTKETVAGVALIDYAPPKGAFTCLAPAAWKGQEETDVTDTITFLGPWSPKGVAYIHILQYPHGKNDQWKDAEKYANSFWEIDPNNKQPALEKLKVGDNVVIRFHQERPFYKLHSHKVDHIERHDYALIPVKGGFFEIWHVAPVDSYQETLPIFEAVVRSFKPKI